MVSMPTLDRSRPYSETHGEGRVLYAQDGYAFTRTGELVMEPDPEPLLGSAHAAASAPVILTKKGVPTSIPADDMRLSANKALKVQMENFGETWQGIEHAKKFLGIIE